MRCRRHRRFKTPLCFLAGVLFCIYSASYLLFSEKENKPRRLAICQPYPACMENTNVDMHDGRGVERKISSDESAKEIVRHGDFKWSNDTLQIVDAARHDDYKRIEDILRRHDMKVDLDGSGTSKMDKHSANKEGVPTSDKIVVNLSAPGEMGKPFIVSPADQAEADRLFPINSFNLFASDRISLNRSLPDIRSDGCSDLKYPSILPDTTVVIIFHNEAWSTLWRTVHSVINRSPAYLKEIILVDDASSQDHLKSQLDEYARRLTFNVRIIRFAQRVGSIIAKQEGLNSAIGEIVMFLDSHCEVFEGWLEPLVFRIAQNRSTVVQPVIDNINDETFALEPYPKPPPQGVFSWELNFGWLYVRETVLLEWNKNNTIPLKSAAMAGGVFAIDKSFFNELGGYDDGFKIWGGDQMDLSFKTWMCGGTLETIPCSHVGHIQRYHNKPYKDHKEGNYISKNDKRIAEIWMEPEYKDFFFYMRPDAQHAEMADISRSVQLRKKCKSFGWYLENVFIETAWPTKHSIFGQVKSLQSGYCFNYEHEGDILMSLQPCQARGVHDIEQLWAFTDRGEIKHNHICMDSSGVGNIATPLCHFRGGNQKWFYRNETNRIIHTTGQCLDSVEQDGVAGNRMLTVSACDPGKPSQDWRIQMKPWKEWYRDYEQSRDQLSAKQLGQQ